MGMLYLSETRPPPGEGELISQCIGFCSCSGLSCCHPLHTAGPCSLCSLCRTPTSPKPGERSAPLVVCAGASHHCSQTDTILFYTMSFSTSPCLKCCRCSWIFISEESWFIVSPPQRDYGGQVQPKSSGPGVGLLLGGTSAGISSHQTSNLKEGNLHPVILLCFSFFLMMCLFISRICLNCAIFIPPVG